jgi:hypothetical protein
MSKENPDYLDTLAEVYLNLGEKEKAKKINAEALRLAKLKQNQSVIVFTQSIEQKIEALK